MCCSPTLTLIALSRFTRMFAIGANSYVLLQYLLEPSNGFTQVEVAAALVCAYFTNWLFATLSSVALTKYYPRISLCASSVLAGLFGVAIWTSHEKQAGILIGAAAMFYASPTSQDIATFSDVESAILKHEARKYSLSFDSIMFSSQIVGHVGQAAGVIGSGFFCWKRVNDDKIAPRDAFREVMLGASILYGVLLLRYLLVPLTPTCQDDDAADVVAALVEDRAAEQQQDNDDNDTNKSSSESCLSTYFGIKSLEAQRLARNFGILAAMDAFASGCVAVCFVTVFFHRQFSDQDYARVSLLIGSVHLLGATSLVVVRYFATDSAKSSKSALWDLSSNVCYTLLPLIPGEATSISLLLVRQLLSRRLEARLKAAINGAVDDAEVTRTEYAAVEKFHQHVRGIAIALSPLVVVPCAFSSGFTLGIPFICAGVLKCLYDVLIYLLTKNFY